MFNEKDFLPLAKSLISSQEPSECEARTAANRAYYSAYLMARNLVDHIPDTDEKVGAHERVLIKLENATNHHFSDNFSKVRIIGNTLRKAKAIRHKADYKLENSFPTAEAKTNIGLSEQVIKLIEAVVNASDNKDHA